MKTPEEMNEAAAKLRKDASELPEKDFFGDSNSCDIEEMLEWATCLEKAAKGDDYNNVYVTEWIYETWSPLCDCLD